MVLFDPHRYAYPSRRSVVYARRAMACTSVPLGAQVGLDVMKAGGNAVDAAVAMAAAMPLLEPTSNGLGSDCFALRNLTTQLQIYFKITNGLHIRTKEGVGTAVCFEIPLNWEGGDPAC